MAEWNAEITRCSAHASDIAMDFTKYDTVQFTKTIIISSHVYNEIRMRLKKIINIQIIHTYIYISTIVISMQFSKKC